MKLMGVTICLLHGKVLASCRIWLVSGVAIAGWCLQEEPLLSVWCSSAGRGSAMSGCEVSPSVGLHDWTLGGACERGVGRVLV